MKYHTKYHFKYINQVPIRDGEDALLVNWLEVTEIKKGLKENTLVATVKSHTHNVPTLLIEHT